MVSFRAAPDFEAPGDDDGDNVYDIIVTASDGANSTEQPVAITVTNENDNVPAFISPATVRVAENQVAAYEAAAADADGGPLSYSLSGTDAALFTIDANTGAVSFRAAPDFEAPGDDDGDNVYDIIVTASDDTNSTEQPVAITVTNENDNVPAFTSPATVRVAENQVAAYEAAAADADGGPLSYSLSGTDAALFTIDANTGAVSFRAAPDFEAPGDADGDNVYDIIVTASDDTNSTEQPVAITVTNENDNVPAFTSPATARVAENQVAAYEAAAADADGGPLSYSLSGTDAALFTIDANTGVVSFRAAPDFEAPGDADGDNVYDIIVTASDDTNSTEQPVAITVTNENDNAPAFTSPATVRVAENQVAAYEAAAADADGGPLSYSLSGTDAALFTIDADTGAVSFRAAPDFEAPGDADGDNVYDIIVTASDGANSTEQPVAITVTNDNDNPPAFTSPATVRVAENQVAAYEAAATDADGDPLSYSLSGTDAALFTIDANTGAVSFRAAPDFEAPGDADGDNVYDIIVTASDDTNSTEQPVAITVTNENDNVPAFISPATVRVAENQVAAYEAAAADADGGPLSYSLSGTDAALFTIDANTGAVSFRAAPDFEVPGDDDGDNVYDIIVTASDGANSREQPVTITVTNENDNAPAFTSPATVRVAENQVAAYEAAAADADGGPLSYSLSGTDAALFMIDADTGAVSFRAAPDFEAPGDADRDNVYDIIVTASDGANSTEQPVAITVTNDNDNPPAFTSPATVRVAENQVAAYEAAATDADGDPLSYSLSGTDAALFTIDANTGAVSFRAAPDFEAPGDADGDNVYDIIVTASDDTNSTEQPVAITVTNENDNVPAFISPATVRVAENQVAAYEAAAADADGGPLSYSLSGTDAALFTIDANTGAVSFRAAPDFEVPGDDDGDNVYDIIVTASDGANSREQPVTITVTDDYEPIPLSSLDGTTGFILNGIDARDQSGRSVSSAGDVNGDGYDDLIIGAPGADPNGDSGAGETYVVYGGANAPGTGGKLDLSSLDGTNGFILNGIDALDDSGWSVSSAGDVNGDGYDDLIIGADGADPNGYDTVGETYVVYGRASAPGTGGELDLSSLDGTNGFILNGIDASDQSGRSVSSAGDVNGDGYDDLIIGAREADPNGDSGAGETYVVYGRASAPGTGGELDLSSLDGTNGFILNGIDEYDYSGWSVSSAGDVNGDGYNDLIIGAREADPNGDDEGGETYVVYGGASAPGTGGRFNLSSLDGTNGFILNGINEDDESGRSVSSAGDFNGDGYDDLIIGASGADPNGRRSGETYVVYGGASAPGTGGELDLSSLDGTTGFILNGIDAYDFSGFSVSSAGDVNGDGYDDLIIGALGADPNGGNYAGETYVIYGGANAPGTGGRFNLSSLDGTTGFILTGVDAGDNAGRSVSSAGDVNGDGYNDLIIGAWLADPNGDSSAGETYVVYGGATGTESLVPVTAQGTAAVDNFTGNAGADSFTGIAADDVVRGGAGDDNTSVTALDFAAVDGGTGRDTLILDGSGLSLDLTGAGHASVDSVEVFDLSDTGSNTLVLDAQAVFDVTEERAGGVARVDVLGDADDRVDLGGSNFALTGTVTEDGTAFTVYSDGNAQVRVEDGVQVQIPPVVFTSPATVRVGENQVSAYEAAAADADGDPLSYGLSGTDAALFTIDANTGVVSFRAAPDFEAPGDADGDNVYDIIVTASDGANSTEQPVAITVTNENDNVPAFTSPATVRVAENQVAAYEAAAADADGDPLSYSLSGTDADLFTIDANTGAVSFRAAPDFEVPGDADGDNVYDIIVTASDGANSTEQPVAITVTDEYDLIPLSTLDGANGFILNGIDARDYSGFSVSSAGDVNGDGYDDLIIGANSADPNGDSGAGETYVVYGGASAPGTGGRFNLSALDGTTGFILNGIDADDRSSGSVSSAGDVNGDGYDDLIIGATGADPNGDSRAGETYVIYGGANAPGTGGKLDLSKLAMDGNGFILAGIDEDDFSGGSVSSAGDVNGDGYDDLIIGATGADPNGDSRAGETYVIYGGASGPGTGGRFNLSALDGTTGFTLTGIDADDLSGVSVSSAGDVNGDGYDDSIIGAVGADPNGGRSGEAYIVYGGAGAPGTDGVLDLSTLDGTNGFILNGIDADDLSGVSVSSAGDVNGDGYDDLIIGADWADPNGSRSGETYVVYGGASAPGTGGKLDLSALDGTNGFILNGIDADDRSGRSVSSAGDVNGDGYDDLIIGAYRADPNGDSEAGETYVVYGGANAPGTGGELDLSSLDGTNGFILNGIDRSDQSGRSASSAGDVNGDGYDDLIIGANRGDPNGDSSGETYVVYGGATGTESLVPVTAQGTAAVDNFTGNAGADSFTGIATDDVVRGGAGDDNTSVTALDFAAVDGGTGRDTLILDGSGLSLDLTGAGHASVDSVEVFDLSGTGSNTLVLDAQAVFDVTEERAGGVASLDVLGDADDRVDLGGSNFALTGTETETETEDGTAFAVYSDGNAQVRVEDGVQVQVQIPPVVFTSPATVSVAENQVAAYEAAAADADGGPLSYSLSGTDAALFTIDANTGVVSFRAAPDFEAPGDDDGDNVYDIIVTASDGANSTEQPVAITVTNENDSAPAFTSPATVRVAENQGAAYEAAAADADGGPLSYRLSGTDAAVFTIDANTGVVSFRAAPDFEVPGDADGDNVYDIIVTASDDTNSTNQNVAITVTNENDSAPAFTSPATARVAENQVAAYEAAAADADGGPLSYSLSGTDAALFTIDANTGVVSFRAAPDFEAPGDDDGDNVYDIIVTASDGANSTEQPVAITVTNENEALVFTSPATARVAENQVAAYEAAAADADGDSPSYSLSGTDAALFTIDANTGVVSFRAAPDFEVPGDADGDNVYDIIVTASDGANSTEQPVAITVTNDNDNAPAFTSPATVRVAENQVAAYAAAAADADGGPLSYGLSGTDAALFTIDANTGAVSFRAAPDFEVPGDADGDNVYDIIVTASDDTNSTNQNVAITVTNENEALVFTSPATARVAENQVAAYEAAAADADGDPLSYSLSGTDAALFTIDANTGVVSFRAAPDFEAPGDADGDNVYDIIVTASDDTNSTEQPVTITVTNENDNVPAFTSPATVRVAENQVAAYEAAAADADGDPLSYGLSGTDAALFTIDANTGAVSFRAAPDFEAPGDADGDNVYDIIVTASDGANSTNQNVAITVTNENDNVPAFTLPATVRVAENQVAAYEAAAADADGGPLSYSLSGTDAALFMIDANTGVVSFRAAPDFEAPGDADGDNVYDIIVTASDGANSTEQPVAITVTDEYDLIPLSTLDGANGFILNGIDARDYSGFSVSSAGDVNGDGYDDLIIGANSADPNGDSGAGETYVVYGGASAPGTGGRFNLSALDGTNGFILNGIDADDRSSGSVSSAGDVNGDGYDDLIIGATGADPNGDSRAGETYVIYGGANAPGTGGKLDLSKLAMDGNGFILAGIDEDDFSGGSVSSAGDVNGDGYDDLIIGATGADPNGDSRAGETYVIYGGASGPGTGGRFNLSALDGTTGFTLTGIDADDLSGVSVSSAGDVNGDGYDDSIIGAVGADPNGGRSGEAYIVYGGAGAPGTDGVLDLSTLDGTNGFILNGIDADDLSGVSVSSAGDVNGDGYDDLIIGADWADPNGSRSGETYVVYGGASAPGTGGKLDLSALDGTNGFILNGIDADDRSGRSVSSAGDVNGDGYDDLIIGAYRADPNGDSEAGETYVVYGGANAPGTGGELDLSTLDGTNGFILNGIDRSDQSGRSASSAGDVNGDGYDDLIIGANRGDPNGDSSGETYVVYGGATGTESLVPVTAQGTAAVDNFTGNAGADSFTGIATDDVVRGGAGDDVTSVTALDFAAVDGGTGRDTLILDGAGLSLDLTGAGHASVDSVEVFDLSGTGSNTLVLDAQAVFDVTEERAGGVASLDVLGDADDRVDLGGGNFALTGTVTEEDTTFTVYSDGNAQVRVETGVGVTLAGSMGAGAAFGANGDADPERIEDRDASGLSVRLDEDTDGDGDVDLVTYEGDADFVGNFPNNIGLEVVRLDGLDGDGSTDLTIPDEFVFAGNPTGNQVRIEGGSTDTLRFDMDDFAEAQEAVGFRGESYRSFASDDQMWSFLVDADVMLFDI